MSCKCIFNPPPESIEGTVSKQGKLYTRLSRNLIFLHRPRIRRFIWWASIIMPLTHDWIALKLNRKSFYIAHIAELSICFTTWTNLMEIVWIRWRKKNVSVNYNSYITTRPIEKLLYSNGNKGYFANKYVSGHFNESKDESWCKSARSWFHSKGAVTLKDLYP